MSKKNKTRRTSTTGRTIIIFLLLAIIGACAYIGAILFEPEKPRITVSGENSYMGVTSKFDVDIHDSRSGLRSVEVSVQQNDTVTTLYQVSFPRINQLSKCGPSDHHASVAIDPKKHKLQDGDAQIIITAHDHSLNGFLQGNESKLIHPVTIDTDAPKISARHKQRYIQPGGCGIVIYSLSEPAVKHGVKLHDNFFPGFPLEGKEGLNIAYLALEWDATTAGPAQIVAYDQAGNEGKLMFSMVLKKVNQKFDRINVGNNFLQNKIPEFQQYYPEMEGTDLEKYLYINNTVRQKNAEGIQTICSKPHPERLWEGRFLRMKGASRAGFADRRTYYHQGKAVDKQTHLGMDIASTTAAEVKAANRGIVVFADYYGIYGNMVILDHGQSVFSLYSHMSRIDAALGDTIEKGGLLGHTGATGMAGGDHLHFAMMIHGVFTSPLEWWDAAWITTNITDVISDEQL